MQNLEKIAKQLVASGKGILAADESTGTIKKRFEKVGIEDTVENHRRYRELLFTTPGIEEFISGVIMFDETIRQRSKEGVPFPEILSQKGIIPGIKVDEGKVAFPGSPKEFITEGLEDLEKRLVEYKALGAEFTKWRNVYLIDKKENLPSDQAIDKNAQIMAQYADQVQKSGLVPIVEPEVLMEGNHGIKDSEMATMKVLKKVFASLSEAKVGFSEMLLKPNWIHPGLETGEPDNQELAEATLRILRAVVPSEVPGIVFLSGGDSPESSTEHLNALNKLGATSWEFSFSFGRALQEPVLEAWLGKEENVGKAQEIFYKRAKLNSLARSGKYEKSMEKEQ